MNFILCYVLYSLSTWVYPKYLLWVVKSHQHIAEVHLELLSILTSGETALLLSLICLARSNTKWVEQRYCYSCIKNDCSNVVFNTQLEKKVAVQRTSEKNYMLSVSSIVCWVKNIWKEIFKAYAQDQSNLPEQLKIQHKIYALLPFTKQTQCFRFCYLSITRTVLWFNHETSTSFKKEQQ